MSCSCHNPNRGQMQYPGIHQKYVSRRLDSPTMLFGMGLDLFLEAHLYLSRRQLLQPLQTATIVFFEQGPDAVEEVTEAEHPDHTRLAPRQQKVRTAGRKRTSDLDRLLAPCHKKIAVLASTGRQHPAM